LEPQAQVDQVDFHSSLVVHIEELVALAALEGILKLDIFLLMVATEAAVVT
jgi:hypothetical protein